jgi:L-seryl-tRNA(Ser) seleniumtransferase
MTGMNVEKETALAIVPSVDAILREVSGRAEFAAAGAARLTELARSATDSIRGDLLSCALGDPTRESLTADAVARVERLWRIEVRSGTRRVINATGVVIHTNLGRAPLSDAAREAIADAAGYCNLEYDLETGRRGSRGARAERLIAELTGAESALIVNNCAAAAFLVLRVLASGGEVIVSRGELVEIGGDFRVPDVLAESGARLVEVGTTNRTKLADYERAITESTALILKVHPSNYRIVGFTAATEVSELAGLAHRSGILLFEDAGSGALVDLSGFGLDDEPLIARSVAAGADIVSFSGDKLVGGIQAGFIVGRRDSVERLRRHPLYRALRIDKTAYAAIEATLGAYRRDPVGEIPVLRMLSTTADEIEARAMKFAAALNDGAQFTAEVVRGHSVVGGGSAPGTQPETALVVIGHELLSAARIDGHLRSLKVPVISRIIDGRVAIDLRTVSESEEPELLEAFAT